MPVITEDELKEYQLLKSVHTRELVQQSLNSIEYLEQDIDSPIKKCVMALALLGCSPIFSCCGFDYSGQPLHKTHQHGTAYIMMEDNNVSRHVISEMRNSIMPFMETWVVYQHENDGMDVVSLTTNIVRPKYWNDISCIHFSELGATRLQYLEDFLMSLSDSFDEEVTLKDSNETYQDRFPWWQYPPKKPWTIRKPDLVTP
jgi:hypothetical protein